MNGIEERKPSRIEELEASIEFQRLPPYKKLILLSGERLLEIQSSLKRLETNTSLFSERNFGHIKNAITQQIYDQLKSKFELNKLVNDPQISQAIFEQVEYKAEQIKNTLVANLKNKIDEINTSLEDVVFSISEFKQSQLTNIKNFDSVQNSLLNLEQAIFELQTKNNLLSKNFESYKSLVNEQYQNYNLEVFNQKFETPADLEKFLTDKTRKVAVSEIESYLIEQEIFLSSEQNQLLKDLVADNKESKQELLSIYQKQLEQNERLDQLSQLMDRLSSSLNSLGEEKHTFITALTNYLSQSKAIEPKKVEQILTQSLKVHTGINQSELDSRFSQIESVLKDYLDKKLEKITSSNLQHESAVFNLVNDWQANFNETLKQQSLHIKSTEFLNKAENGFKADFLYAPFEHTNDWTQNQDLVIFKYQLEQIIHKLKAKTDYYDREISYLKEKALNASNSFLDATGFDNQISILEQQFNQDGFNTDSLRSRILKQFSQNSESEVNIDGKIESNPVDFKQEFLYEDDWDMKHNYYGGSKTIPGTKITRIANYRINNDITNDVLEIETQDQQEIEDILKNSINLEQKEKFSEFVAENQKILELENLIQKQREEIDNLKIISEQRKMNEAYDTNDFAQYDKFSEKLNSTLKQFKDLLTQQESTTAVLTSHSKKLADFEERISNLPKTAPVQQVQYVNNEAFVKQEIERRELELKRKEILNYLEKNRQRLLAEISYSKNKLDILNKNPIQNQQPTIQPQVQFIPPVEQPVIEEVVVKKPPFASFAKKEKPAVDPSDLLLLEPAKKKRKQQFFYEIKIHNRPKLTKVDLEK